MIEQKLVNAHFHEPCKNARGIQSLDIRKLKAFPENNFCLGVHPWWPDAISKDELEKVMLKAIDHKYFCAIGELGLDKVRSDWDKQVEILMWQLEFAQKYGVSNIVIHSIRAHNELFKILKNYDFKILWHDFNGNEQVIKQLSNLKSYFSLGPSFLKNNSKINQTISSIDHNRLLFETDCLSDSALIDVYNKASLLLKMPLHKLVRIINQNFDNYLLKSDRI